MSEFNPNKRKRMEHCSRFSVKISFIYLMIFLLGFGCNEKTKLAFGRFCLEGNIGGVQEALSNGANPNWTIGPSGMKPLMLAACGIEVSNPTSGLKSDPVGRVAVIKLLLSRGADPQQKNSGGYGSLFYAQLGNLPEACRLLVVAGARPDEVEKSGYSAIHFASTEGKSECLAELINGLPAQALEIRTAPTEPGTQPETPLMMAAREGKIECIKILLKAGASRNSTNSVGSALTYAAMFGHLEVVEYLLNTGSNIEEPAGNKSTPLKKAAFGGHVEVVKYLLSRGALVNATDKHGRTALMEAAYKGHPRVVELLLKANASVDLIDDKGHKAIDLAISSKHPEVADIISKGK